MSSSFPSSVERKVASSLLLLNTTPLSPSISTPNDAVPERRSRSRKRFREISVSYGSDKSSYSSLTDDDDDDDDGNSSEKEIKSRSVSFSAIARYHQMKLKIARKIRTKVTWSTSCSGDRKLSAGELAKVLSPASGSGEASSCLSSSSSGISSSRSLRYAKRCRGAIVSVAGIQRETAAPSCRSACSPHLRRRGEAILKLLSGGGSSELNIRQMLGDSPDTSKALRMLLRVDAVKRSGSGGRYDPYVYTITG